ncbi:MAG: FecR family protein [Asticcacaulis sp.]
MTSRETQNERERAEDEAAEFLILLQENPDDRDLRARLEVWCNTHTLNGEIWQRTLRAYGLVGLTPPHHKAHWEGYSVDIPVPETTISPKRFTRRKLVASAVAACLMLVVAPVGFDYLRADYATATGVVHRVTLKDGSVVRLAPQSAIDVAFKDNERRVKLLKGAAFFEVTPDAQKPFRVEAGGVKVTVLGTAFDVKRKAQETDVAVQHGHVHVESRGLSEHLRVGDSLSIEAGGRGLRGKVQPDEVGGWAEGELVVRDRPVSEVVEAMRPYYRGVIILNDKAFAERRVTGVYRLDQPVDTLTALAASHGANVQAATPWVMLVNKNN